ncbi:hypothetical protein J6590_082219 [Homalodisca vitripennis]|nr:hypothetical protein J6590_082219 [Homalodisca vitripennis]
MVQRSDAPAGSGSASSGCALIDRGQAFNMFVYAFPQRKHVDTKYSNEEDVTSKVDYCDDLGLQTEPLIWLLYLITLYHQFVFGFLRERMWTTTVAMRM